MARMEVNDLLCSEGGVFSALLSFLRSVAVGSGGAPPDQCLPAGF